MIKHYECTIEGISSLLMNRFTEEAEASVQANSRPASRGQQRTPREEATPKAYRYDDGGLYVPANNLYQAIMEAGRHKQLQGKKKVTTRDSSELPGGCWIIEQDLPLGVSDFEVDSRPVVNPSTKGRVMCHRPRLDEWRLTFTLEVDVSEFDPDLIYDLVEIAGKKIGLCDYRPQCKGPFGRFKVVRWDCVSDETGGKEAA